MSDREARRSMAAGRAGKKIIPQVGFERGCFALGALLLAEWAAICLMWAVGL